MKIMPPKNNMDIDVKGLAHDALTQYWQTIDSNMSGIYEWSNEANKVYDRQLKSPYMISFCVGVDITEKKYKELINKLTKSFNAIVSVDKRFKECINNAKYDEKEGVVRIYINADRAEEFNVKIGYVSGGLSGKGSTVDFIVDAGGWGFECFRDPETFYALSFTINYFYDNIRIYAEK
jgi:hypothetical protein